jgi:uncharacterized cupredoxin-like copper-binding protein
MNKILKSGAAGALAIGMSVFTLPVIAGPAGHGDGPDIGQAGDPANVTRTIEVVMYDNYYEPEDLELKEGETVKFVIKNAGEFVHEFNIATAEMHKKHAPEMMMMMEHGVLEADKINWEAAKDMQAKMGHGMHEEPNSVLLEPGQSAEIVWMFPDHAELEFACNIPGHYDSGMVGEINLTH